MEKPRYFQHFKGGLYQFIDIALHSETQEEMVVYRPLYGEKKLWVRPKAMFFENVERDGKVFPRFREISEIEMLKIKAEQEAQK